jgi:hypothetical protein
MLAMTMIAVGGKDMRPVINGDAFCTCWKPREAAHDAARHAGT